jgi:hypothetical protein
VNPPELTILTTDTDAVCDLETGTCAVPQTTPPAPDASPVEAGLSPR